MKHAINLLTALLLLPLSALSASDPAIVTAGFIFDPAPHPQCHSSTIVETKSGLVAAWFGGTKEGNPDVGIRLSRHRDGKWSVPVKVANGAERENQRVNCRVPGWQEHARKFQTRELVVRKNQQ